MTLLALMTLIQKRGNHSQGRKRGPCISILVHCNGQGNLNTFPIGVHNAWSDHFNNKYLSRKGPNNAFFLWNEYGTIDI